MRKHLVLVLCACLAIGFVTSLSAAQTTPNKKAAVKKLRDFFFERDFTAGYEAGQKLLRQFPNDDELRMWAVLNGVRAIPNNKAALEMANDMVTAKSDSVHGLIALAMANSYNGKADDALKAAEKAVEIAPNNEEAIFTYNSIIFRATKYTESLAWLDKNADRITDRSRFYNARGISGYFADKKERAFQDFETSIKVAQPTVNSLFLYADYLNREKRIKEALPLIKKAVQSAPYSLGNRVAYWRMLSEQPGKTDEQKEREVVADINALLRARPNSPEILLNVSIHYGLMKNTEKKEFYEARILKKFPNSKFAEPIIVERIIKMTRAATEALPSAEYTRAVSELGEARQLGDKELLSKALKSLSLDQASADKISEEWRAFIRRPRHFEMTHLSTAHFSLFYRAMYDFGMPDEKVKEFLDTVGKLKNNRQTNTNREIADFLAVRKVYRANPALTADTLAYARAGIEEAETDAADYRATMNAKDAEQQTKSIRSKALQTLGFALYLENRFDEAEKELLKARELNGDNTDALLTLALIYKARKEYDKAEDIYLTLASISKPYITSIRELYREKNGGLREFDAYYQDLKEKIRAKIRIEVAASRIREPKDLVPFDLKKIDQGSMSSADVKGKVAVINFWGVWCIPCVKEMPEIQELANKYKNDSDVAIMAFDIQDSLETVRKFIAERKYDFPVLVADSYNENLINLNSGMVSYPTTLFVDKKGKISFIKVGNTGNLVEEFSMRIDILKQDK